MRHTRNLLLLVLFATAGLGLVVTAVAPQEAAAQEGKRAGKKAKDGVKKGAKQDQAKAANAAKAAMARTHKALKAVGPKVKESGKGTAEFKKAVAHQKAARKALRERHPHMALHLTRKARTFLKTAAEAAGAQPPAELETTPEEQTVADEAPVDETQADTLVTEAESTLPADDALLADESFGDAEEPAAEESPAE